jgi:large subunit ribosomal protein L31e
MADEGKEIERIYRIPLIKAKHSQYTHAAPRAIKAIRSYLIHHMKVTEDNVWIDDSVNHAIWSGGGYRIPSSIRVRAVKFEDGVVEASIPELGLKKSRRELLKEEKEKKTPILRREEREEEPSEGEESGTEDVKVSPAADGTVKVKKKKAPKEKAEEEPTSEEAGEKKEKPKKEAKPKKAPAEKKPAKSGKKTEKPASSKSKRKAPASKKEK